MNQDNTNGLRDVLEFITRQPCRCMSIAQLGERDYCDRCQSVKNLRALLARTEAGADECTLGVGDGSGQLFVHGSYDAIKACQALTLRNAAPVAEGAVAWVLAYPDGSISRLAAVYRRKENAEKHIASYGGSLGLVPMPLYTHPQDASGDAVAELIAAADVLNTGAKHGLSTYPEDWKRLDAALNAMQAKEAK